MYDYVFQTLLLGGNKVYLSIYLSVIVQACSHPSEKPSHSHSKKSMCYSSHTIDEMICVEIGDRYRKYYITQQFCFYTLSASY